MSLPVSAERAYPMLSTQPQWHTHTQENPQFRDFYANNSLVIPTTKEKISWARRCWTSWCLFVVLFVFLECEVCGHNGNLKTVGFMLLSLWDSQSPNRLFPKSHFSDQIFLHCDVQFVCVQLKFLPGGASKSQKLLFNFLCLPHFFLSLLLWTLNLLPWMGQILSESFKYLKKVNRNG